MNEIHIICCCLEALFTVLHCEAATMWIHKVLHLEDMHDYDNNDIIDKKLVHKIDHQNCLE